MDAYQGVALGVESAWPVFVDAANTVASVKAASASRHGCAASVVNTADHDERLQPLDNESVLGRALGVTAPV